MLDILPPYTQGSAYKKDSNEVQEINGLFPTLLEKFWRISLHLTDKTIAKLYFCDVKLSKKTKIVENYVTQS